jgi:acyl-CoA synthetase (NDP forming)
MMASPETRSALEADGLPVFEDPDRVVAAVARLAAFREAFAREPRVAAATARPRALPLSENLSEAVAKRLLGAAGIPFAPEKLAASAEQAVAAAAAFDRPVALKIISPDIAHKSDIGAVLLDVTGAGAVAAGFRSVTANARAAHPDAQVDGVAVSPMIAGGIETVMGAKNDPDFGPVVMFGLGGIHVEVFKDVTFRLAPVDVAEAEAMIRSIRGAPILEGTRGTQKVDIGTLARSLSALSRFAAAHSDDIESIDINPFIALPEGGCAVDALIVRRNDANSPVKLREAVGA